MAGSDQSGEDMESGRTNRAEDQTRIWAQTESGQEFHGDVVLVVEAARDIEDDDFGNPSPSLHAIRGSSHLGAGIIGLSSEIGDINITLAKKVGVFGKGDTGVRGQGHQGVEGVGTSLGTGDGSGGGFGVVGRGGRRATGKFHGVGVVGLGGSHAGDQLVLDEHVIAGAGIIGQGAQGENQQRPGAGMIGRGGGSVTGGDVAPGIVGLSSRGLGGDIDIGHGDSGVVGLGGTGVTGLGIVGPGVRGFGGPNGPTGEGDPATLQAGVIGEGGTIIGDGGRDIFGTGVVGIARDTPALGFAETGETGVYGTGQIGVKGVGISGSGGVFASERAAQIQLVPSRGPRIVEQSAIIPTAATDPGRLGPPLPRAGRGGDLMTFADDQGQCTLWFCTRSATTTGPATWTQALLGPRFDGRA